MGLDRLISSHFACDTKKRKYCSSRLARLEKSILLNLPSINWMSEVSIFMCVERLSGGRGHVCVRESFHVTTMTKYADEIKHQTAL